MLRARVISEGVNTVYPGATSGMITPEEAADIPVAGPELDVTPAKPASGLAALQARVAELKPQAPALELTPDAPPSKVTLADVLDAVESATTAEELDSAAVLAKALADGEREIVRPKFRARREDLASAS
jgi:hypothetical protein